MGSLTSVSSGTLTADGTEQTIFADAGENFLYHMAKIFVNNMVASDKVTIRIYDWDIVAAAFVLADTKKLQDVQTDAKVGYVPPLPQHRMKVTLEQTATGVGGYKNFNWERLSN